MTSPDIQLLKQKIGLQPDDDFPWIHQLRQKKISSGGWQITLGGASDRHKVSVKWLRFLLRLSRLDRAIDQRKKVLP